MKTSIKNAKTFTTALNGIRKTGATLRKDANNVVLFGLEHYGKNGDTHYLHRAFKACVGNASLDTKQMLAFITKHANVKIENQGCKDEKFIKAAKGVAKYAEPTVPWFEFEAPVSNNDGMKDADKWLENAIKTMTKTIEGKKYKDMVHAAKILAALKTIKV